MLLKNHSKEEAIQRQRFVFFHPVPYPVTFAFLKEVIKVMISIPRSFVLPNSLSERLQEQVYTLTPFFSIMLYIIQ